MSSDNPYQAPEGAEIVAINDADRALEWATRGQRFAAALIDTSLMMATAFLLLKGMGHEFFVAKPLPVAEQVMLASLCFAAFLVFHGWLLATRGQTVGKFVLKIRIEHEDGTRIGIGTLLARRILPVSLIAYIPVVGGFLSLLDILFIFGSNQRCLHDYLADSRVVKLPR